MIRLSEIFPGDRIAGIIGEPVEVVQTAWELDTALRVTYRKPNGDVGEAVVFDDQEDELHRVSENDAPKPVDVGTWKVATEAIRLKHAALIDPMLAVSSSTLQPLPHQITAVYGEFLPRTPLRYLLADDPGAGKTIMCGLYIKELMLRGDLSRCLIVAPGGLVDQWAQELWEKFGLSFRILTRELITTTVTDSVFHDHPLLIARMDMLSRDDALREQIGRSEWDLVVVDEAHRMSASGTTADSKQTSRYTLGTALAESARNFLLLTATPHSGDPERFQAFLALLDRDRFGSHRVQETARPGTDLMRRMLKENLLTLEGKHLFPERKAQTVAYRLTALEADLYDEVSEYVRLEMNRAEALQKGQTRTVGFALTVLQRRLASSPEAILKSLVRRRDRLRSKRHALAAGGDAGGADTGADPRLLAEPQGDDSTLDEIEAFEHQEALDAATAAQTMAELDVEIATLGRLVDLATRVHASGQDEKWQQLRSILDSPEAIRPDGSRRKFIVFTEHRDTLAYLDSRITALPRGRRTVLQIHGGLNRKARLAAQDRFRNDPDADVLLATDAAGEGLNLQVANLMVNYDLPWNPNRLEQRFGRIHRIGQTEVCHLWNLVAADTREGDVYQRLLTKMEEQSLSLQGKVFDVLGEAFADNTPLEELLTRAIRYGDDPDVKRFLDEVVDATVGKDIPDLVRQRAHHTDVLRQIDLAEAQRRAEEGARHALQPHFTGPWFLAGFNSMGGRIRPASAGLYDVRHVPSEVKDEARKTGEGPVLRSTYLNVSLGRHNGGDTAATEVVGPGNHLFDATAAAVIRLREPELREVAVLVDPSSESLHPRVFAAASHEVVDGSTAPVSLSREFDFVELTGESARRVGPAYLDYRAPLAGEAEAVSRVVQEFGELPQVQKLADGWTIRRAGEHRARVAREHGTAIQRRRQEIEDSLTQEAAHWERVALGEKRQTVTPETARRRAAEARDRLAARRLRFEAEARVTARPPQVHAVALVLPIAMLGGTPVESAQPVEATIAALAERGIGVAPDASDERTLRFDGGEAPQWWRIVHRPAGDRVSLRRTDVATALNLGDAFRLLLCDADRLRLARPRLDGNRFDDLLQHEFTTSWFALWRDGRDLA